MIKQHLDPHGEYHVQQIRDGEVIWEETFPNGITNEGKNYFLETGFNGGTAISTWHLGLIDLTGYSALAAADTYDNIDQSGNGWDEFADYTDPAESDSAILRPEWTAGTAASQTVTNSSPVDFEITDAGTVKGVFLAGGADADTKSDHTASGNILFGTALFGTGDRAVLASDILRVTYSVTT